MTIGRREFLAFSKISILSVEEKLEFTGNFLEIRSFRILRNLKIQFSVEILFYDGKGFSKGA